MSVAETESPIQIGVVASEPMRLEGLVSIFERTASTEHPPLVPVVGALEEHLNNNEIEYLIIDWDSSRRLGILEGIRRKRPSLRMVVIGPENSDDIVMNTIIAGARAYLDLGAGPRMVRKPLTS